MHVDTLITGATIITMDSARHVYRDGAIAIVGDRIAAVGPRAVIEANCVARQRIDGRRFVVTPGLVNGHVHVTETLIKGFQPEALPFGEGLHRWTIPLYEGQKPTEQAIGAKLAVLSMLRTGTTSFIEAGTILAFDEVTDAIVQTGIRGRVGAWVLDRAFAPDADQKTLTDVALRQLERQLASHPADGSLISAWPILIGHNTNSDALWQGARQLADAHHVGVSAHMSPVADDAAFYLEAVGGRPIEHLAKLGVLGPHLSLVHMVHVSEAEIALLADTGTNVIHCPAAALKGAYGTTRHGRFPEMAEAGVNLLLGTDGSDSADLMQVATLMAGLFKDAREDARIFPATQAIEMATLNGARALGLSNEIGAIAVGMKADLVLHDTDRPEWRPLTNAVNQLIWSADGRGVHSVFVDGRCVVENYRCTTIDEDALYADAQLAAEAVIARSGLPALSAWPIS